MAFPGVLMYSPEQCVLGYPGKSPSALNQCYSMLIEFFSKQKVKKKKIVISIGGVCHLQHLSAHYRSP